MYFVTNCYKRFSKTNWSDPRQQVPLSTEKLWWNQILFKKIPLALKWSFPQRKAFLTFSRSALKYLFHIAVRSKCTLPLTKATNSCGNGAIASAKMVSCWAFFVGHGPRHILTRIYSNPRYLSRVIHVYRSMDNRCLLHFPSRNNLLKLVTKLFSKLYYHLFTPVFMT